MKGITGSIELSRLYIVLMPKEEKDGYHVSILYTQLVNFFFFWGGLYELGVDTYGGS